MMECEKKQTKRTGIKQKNKTEVKKISRAGHLDVFFNASPPLH